jgi:hypothetical protein
MKNYLTKINLAKVGVVAVAIASLIGGSVAFAAVTSVNVGSQNGTATYGTTGSVSYSVVVATNNNTSVSPGVSGLPSGASGTFSPTSHSFNGTFTFTLTVNTSASAAAGATTFTVKAASGRTDTGTLTINKASQTITFGGLSDKTYGNAPFTVSATGGASGNPVTFSIPFSSRSVCSSGGTNGSTITITGVGSCTVQANQNGNDNYNNATQVSQSFTVNPLPVIVSGHRTYDGTATVDHDILSVDNVVGNDEVNITGGNGTLASKNVGPESMQSFGNLNLSGRDASNYTLTNASGTVNITAENLTVAAQLNTKTYDGDTFASAIPKIILGSLQESDTASFTEAYDNKNVGFFKKLTPSGLVNDGNSGDNYSYTFIPNFFGVITKGSLTVSATGINKVYDGTTVATVTLSDNRASGDVLTTSYASAAFSTSTVGTDIPISVTGISVSGTDAGNYTLSNTTATTAADITVSTATVALAPSQNLNPTYDGTAKSLSFATTPSGLALSVTYNGTTTPPTDAGTYDVVAAITDPDYSGSATTTLTIAPAALTITANNESTTYGEGFTFSGTEFTTTGLVASDTVTNVGLTSVGAMATSSVSGSPYPIVIASETAEGTGINNYDISYANGSLTVNPAPLTITASSDSMVEGDTPPTITPEYSGFVNGDTSSTLATQPTCSTTATNTSTPGPYTSSCSGAVDANYKINYVSGTVTVTEAAPVAYVTTEDATNVSSTDAVMNGLNGIDDATGHSFWVSTSTFSTSSPNIPSGVYSTPDFGAINANTPFSASLFLITTNAVTTGGATNVEFPAITPDTTYYYVAWSLVNGTWYPGGTETVITAPAATGYVTTDAASSVGATSATVNGTNGSSAADNTSFWWGTTNPASSFTATADPAGVTPPDVSELPPGWSDGVFAGQQNASAQFNYALTGLTPGTTYYFVAWSQVGGIWYPGAVLSFETSSGPTPSVVTDPADPIAQTTATLNGTNGSVAADNTSFWWGTTDPANAFTVAADPAGVNPPDVSELPSGWSDGVFPGPKAAGAPFSYVLTNLNPGTTYYFVAWSEVGNVWYPGQVLSFPTPAVPVPVPTVTSVAPVSGPAAGGTIVTVTGTNLTGETAVDFGTTPATDVVVAEDGDSLTATAPAGTGTVDVTVTTPGGTSATSDADQFTYVSDDNASLDIIVLVDNSVGGSATSSDFTVSVTATDASTSTFPGAPDPGTQVTIASSTHYSVDISSVANYTEGLSGNCTGSGLPAGGSATCTFTETYAAPTSNAIVGGNGGGGQVSADAGLTQSVDNINPRDGGTVHITLTASNGGPNAAQNVTVLDNLPSGLTFVSANPSVGTYTAGTGMWNITGGLPVGAAPTLVIAATAHGSVGQEITNNASISETVGGGSYDPNSSNNNASQVITIASGQVLGASTSSPGGQGQGNGNNGNGGGQVLGASVFNFGSNLSLGSQGPDVTQLQKELTALGFYDGPINGRFGPLTQTAVKAFQKKYGLPVTGYVGPLTRAKLNELLDNGLVLGASTSTAQAQLLALLQQLLALLQSQAH